VNHHVRYYFEPGREYVEYRDYEDLVAVLQHYLHHDDERAAIAAAGHRRATLHYSHQVFWRGLLARCGASATAFADRLEGDEP
jgi:spore maturation protein CgeB